MICGLEDHNFLASIGAAAIILTMLAAFGWLCGWFDDYEDDDDEPPTVA